MIKIEDLDYVLSLKIGDPVSDMGDGKIFDFDDRLKYLERAYARLLRILPKLMGKETPTFAKTKNIVLQSITDGMQVLGDAIEVKDGTERIVLDDIEELYVQIQNARTTDDRSSTSAVSSIKAIFIDPDKYLSVKNGNNDQYTPSVSKVFYTFFNDLIYLLPRFSSNTNKYTQIELTYKKDAPTLNRESEIPMSREYVDILVVMAANEAMQDIARGDKVNLYTGDLSGQLAILKGYSDKIEAREGSSIDE